MYQRPAPWVVGGLAGSQCYSLNTEDGKERGVWSTLATEEGIFWYVGRLLLGGSMETMYLKFKCFTFFLKSPS